MNGVTNDPKPYGVGAGRLWLEGHLSKLDPKIGEPYASQVVAEIDAYIERRVMDERDACEAACEMESRASKTNGLIHEALGALWRASAIRARSKPLPNPLDPQ